jgi:hypothetical protein
MPKYGKAGLMLLVMVAASVAAISIAGAAATNVTPAGDGLHMTSTNVSFAFGSSVIVCETGEAYGTIASPEATDVPLSNPVFQNVGGGECTTTGTEGAKFKVVTSSTTERQFALSAVSPTSAKLRFPGQPAGIEFISGSCIMKAFKADAPTGTWTNGESKSPYAISSTLKIVNGNFNLLNYEEVKKNPNCPPALVENIKKSGSGSLSATVVVSDYTHPAQAVLLK